MRALPAVWIREDLFATGTLVLPNRHSPLRICLASSGEKATISGDASRQFSASQRARIIPANACSEHRSRTCPISCAIMNLQLHHVISDITGQTGLAIVDALLAGQRDPQQLAKLRNERIKASE